MKVLEGTVGYALVGVGRAHRNRAGEGLARIGLFVGQEWILLRLRDHEGMTPTELAEACSVEGPTISKALRRLEKGGLVERQEDLIDARITRVFLTERGQAACAAVDEVWSDLEKQTVAHLSVEERLLLRRLLLQVQRNLE
ncbi:MAG TPA: MarR family transcriptional regulator [Chloroflexota bacterium]|nr:MarR family transcriptional regulator [Chloroflexota bacterium]